MRNRLQQRSRTSVRTKNSALKYVAGGIALALLGGISTFIYLNIGQLDKAKAADSHTAWYYDFGSNIGKHTSGESTNFLPSPPSGTARVSVPDEKKDMGYFTLQNPGLSNFGVESELKGNASYGASPTKYSVFDYTPGKSVYMKYSLQLSNAMDGEWYFFLGNGSSFSNDKIFANNETFSGLQFSYNHKKSIILNYRNGNAWEGKLSVSANTNYVFEFYGNNSTKTITYDYSSSFVSCGSQTVAPNTMDIYMNGKLIANDISKSGLGDDTNIDSWMFYGINSKKNDAEIYLDDIVYSNAIPASTLQPGYQPNHLTFTDTTSSSLSVSFNQASGNPDGYIVLRKSGSAATTTPVDFTDYTVGELIGDGTVVYVGSNTSFSDNNLISGTKYFYQIFAYVGFGSCKNYLNTLPLEGSQYTFFNEEIAPFSSIQDGTWTVPTVWEYEYLPGKYRKASKAPTSKNKSITVRKKHQIVSSALVADNVLIESEGILTVNGDLTINNSGGSKDMVNKGILQVSGNLTVLGIMENQTGSTIEFNGTATQSIPSGIYSKIKTSNGGIKNLAGDITVNESLTISNSSINTQDYTITLASNATLSGESKGNMITGKVKTTRNIVSDINSFGGLGLEINATVNHQDLGDVTVIRSTGKTALLGTSESISKTWSIEPQYQPLEDVSLTLSWAQEDEKTTLDLNVMQVWKSEDKGKTWEKVGNVQSITSRSITVNTSSFSVWTVDQERTQLPVKFRSFTGKENQDGTMTLNWVTTEELNNEGFQVEKSSDGKTFSKVAFVTGVGNSAVINTYQYKDMSFNTSSYYRLKQIDFNGVYDYSTIIYIEKNNSTPNIKSFSLYPNPVIDHVTISNSMMDMEDQNLEVIIFSSKGRQVFDHSGTLEEINDELSRNIYNWEQDIYIVDIKVNGKLERLKMMKR